MVQARYVAEYGLMFAAAKLSNGAAQQYLQLMRTPAAGELCYAQTAAMAQRSCYRVLETDVQNDISGAKLNVCDKASGTTPGTLGLADVECDFVVELTDLSEGFTMPGFDLGHGKALKFWYVTATSTGQVRRPVDPTSTTKLDSIAGESSSTQTLRSRILVGPFPSN
jgi:hypothetical protein